ncbi:MAG: CoA transferase [Verrucomicrobia bacterium]|nr:CoA transferase [Verrucomicrobiota bacterium]
MTLPLTGVKVLDLSRVLAGPFATQLLGDLGANVVKVEHTVRGDDTRQWGPPFAGGESAYFLSTNRNKRSLTADLRNADDLARVTALASTADVVIENFRRGALARFGLDYPTLRTRNPALVYCSITGFGPGQDQDLPGYDFLVQARGGIMGITGAAGGEPTKVGVAVADMVCGLYAASAILAALYRRQISGTGEAIEVPLFETQISWLANRAQEFLISGEDQGRLGNAHPSIVPYQVFQAADKPLALAVGNDAQFRKLCAALDRPELADDTRFATNPERVRHREPLVFTLAATFAKRPAAEWIAQLQNVGVPCGPLNDLAAVFADSHLRSSGMLQTITHPSAGEVPMLASPICFAGERLPIRRPPPRHGEHSSQIAAQGWEEDNAPLQS